MNPASEVEEKVYGEFSWKYLPGVKIGMDTYLDDFRQHLLPLVRPEWSTKKLESKVFDACLTNALFAIFLADKGLKASDDDVVLLRINGSGTDKMIDRTDELISLVTLHQNNLSPPLYAQLKNGLCYGFISGNHLSPAEFRDPSLMKLTSESMAQLHSVKIPSEFLGREPFLWYKINQWLRIVPRRFDDPIKDKDFCESIGSIEVLEKELLEMKTVLCKCQSPIVFCHNDLLCANFIYNKEKERMRMIDFEYTGPNYLAYDIGNHFCEFAGVETVDYGLYPDEELQKQWLRNYLEAAVLLKGKYPSDVTEAAVHSLYIEVNKFALYAHLFWALWALLQAANSTIDFNYIEYAGIRFGEYKRRKKAFLEL